MSHSIILAILIILTHENPQKIFTFIIKKICNSIITIYRHRHPNIESEFYALFLFKSNSDKVLDFEMQFGKISGIKCENDAEIFGITSIFNTIIVFP